MPKIFVQGEVGADCGLRRDAAHTLEMGDAHGDAIVCVLVGEGIGKPEFASTVACDVMHEVVEWCEDTLPHLAKETNYELDAGRVLVDLSKRMVFEQMRWGDKSGRLPLHFVYLMAYKGEYLVLRVGEARVLRVGADGSFEVGCDPTVDSIDVTQSALETKCKNECMSNLSYELHVGNYEEGDLFLAMTPGLWDRVGETGLTQAYANHLAMDEETLSELTADIICRTGKVGGSDGLTMAGAEMTSFTPYQKLGVKVG